MQISVENSLYSVHRSIEGCLQLIENTGLRVHRILCIGSVHQRYRGKMRFSLGSEISSRKPLCDGLSINALDFGAHHSGDAQPPDQARADCVSGETEHKLGVISVRTMQGSCLGRNGSPSVAPIVERNRYSRHCSKPKTPTLVS